jgi:hypothetical protein
MQLEKDHAIEQIDVTRERRYPKGIAKMTRRIIQHILTALLFATALTLHSQESRRGFFGELQLGAGYLYGTDSQEWPATKLFSSDVHNPEIDDLGDVSETVATWLPYVRATIGFHFDRIDLSIQNSPETFLGDPGVILTKGAGDFGSVSASVSYETATVYQNPFLTGSERKTTDATVWELGVGWNRIMSVPINLNYNLVSTDVAKDEAGKFDVALKRDGFDHSIELSGMLRPHLAVVILPRIGLTIRNRDGGAESGGRYDAGGNLLLFLGPLQSMSGVGYGYVFFETEHPVFTDTRVDQELSLMQMLTYSGILGIQELSYFAMVRYSALDSNINFFDTEQLLFGSGIGYSF